MNDGTTLAGHDRTERGIAHGMEVVRRLVVLLPNADIHEALLARHVWALAARAGASVHIIAMVDDWADEGQVSLRLTLLTALLRESGLALTTSLERDEVDWVRVVRQAYEPGDTIVCHAEQKLPMHEHGLSVASKPLSSFLAALNIPVCEVEGAIRSRPPMTARRAIRTWLLPLTIILVSTALQLGFLQWAHAWADWARNISLIVYTAIEIVVIARLARS
jgi:hypothetical protein